MNGPEWMRRLERRCGDARIDHFAYLLVGLKIFGLLLLRGNPSAYDRIIFLPDRVLAGEWWRLLGFLTVPSTANLFWLFFELYLLFIFVEGLEGQWGAFKVNVYYLIGYLLSVGYALIAGMRIDSPVHLDRTLMLAFAALFPDFRLLLFFILPVKIKWLAWIVWALAGYAFIAGGPEARIYLAVIYANYFLFFGRSHYNQIRGRLRAWLRRRD